MNEISSTHTYIYIYIQYISDVHELIKSEQDYLGQLDYENK